MGAAGFRFYSRVCVDSRCSSSLGEGEERHSSDLWEEMVKDRRFGRRECGMGSPV